MKTFKTIFLSLIFLTGSLFCDSLTVRTHPELTINNNVYLNLFGDGTLASINYERIFQKKENLFYTFKTGLSYYLDMKSTSYELTASNVDDSGLIITNHFTFNYGKKYTFFESGLGTTFYNVKGDQGIIAYPIIGIRRQSNNGSVRLFLHPFYLMKDNVDFILPIGFSFGISF